MLDDASIYTGEKRRLGMLDYILLSLLFCVSAAVGFYHAYRDRKQKETDNFHVGGRKMRTVPVCMSLVATAMSALTLLGIPAEIYTNGTMFMWIIVAMLIATASAAHIFLPVFYQLNKVSVFHYIKLRYGVVLQVLGSIVFFFQTLIYAGFVLYAPSLTLETVTGVSLWGSMVGVAAVCTLYTLLGGMKTVVWTDTLQLIVMIGGLLCIMILGSEATDGFSNAWNIAAANGRIKFDDFSFDPKTRHSVWTVAIGGSLFWIYLYGINQVLVQRALSLPTLRQTQSAIWLNFLGIVFFNMMVGFIGIVMYAFYSGCHPVEIGLVSRNDQLLPLFVLDVIGKYKGLSGIFMACIFSGSLSTISSGLSAISAIVLEDYVKPLSPRLATGTKGIFLSKLLVLIVGVLEFGMAAAISQFPGLIVQFSYSMFSIISGPMLGIFVAGMFFPWTNQTGAITGFLLSIAFMCWLAVGAVIEKPPSNAARLPLYTHLCNKNSSVIATTVAMTSPLTSTLSQATTTTQEPILYNFYRISYQWYTGFGMMVCITLSLIVSFLTGRTKPETLDSHLMCPVFKGGYAPVSQNASRSRCDPV